MTFFDLKDEKARLYKVFKSLDKDGDGQLDRSELKEAYGKNQKLFSTEQELDSIFDKIDVNKTGQIDFSEFLMATIDYKKGVREKEMRQIFSMIDKDKSGSLEKEEVAEFFNLTTPDKGQELQSLMDEADLNKDGKISIEEFFLIMNSFLKEG